MHRLLTVLALIRPVPTVEDVPIASRAALEGGIGVYMTAGGATTVAGGSSGDFSAPTGKLKGAEAQ